LAKPPVNTIAIPIRLGAVRSFLNAEDFPVYRKRGKRNAPQTGSITNPNSARKSFWNTSHNDEDAIGYHIYRLPQAQTGRRDFAQAMHPLAVAERNKLKSFLTVDHRCPLTEKRRPLGILSWGIGLHKTRPEGHAARAQNKGEAHIVKRSD